MGTVVDLVEGLVWAVTIPTIEASAINFARRLPQRIFISYLFLILPFIVNKEESQLINPAVGKGKGKDARKEIKQERGGVAVGVR